MSDLPLTLSMCAYDRTQPLADGRVRPQGIDLRVVSPTIEESIIGMLRYRQWDAAEMSFSAALIAADRGAPAFAVMPVFPSRVFRHSAIFVNSASGITQPLDLEGRRVAIAAYARVAAAVWIRGFLEDDHGLRPSDVIWVVSEPLPVGSADNIPVELPEDVRVESVDAAPALDERLAQGDVDALMTARLPRPFVAGDGRVRRLYEDHRRVEASYFTRTGIFPPMHVIVVRRELYEAEPWIGPSLFSAFVVAKSIVLADAYEIDVSRHSLAWWVSYLEEERRLLGEDPWSYGVVPNRHTIETFVGYCHRQGLISRRLSIEEIFPGNLLDSAG